jgi:protein-tyrosine phosphatase
MVMVFIRSRIKAKGVNMKKNLGLVPLRNFAVVDENDGIYRSAQPMYGYEYNWLKEMLELDVIINLRSESRHDEKLAGLYGIKVINIDVPDHHEPSVHQADHFIELIKKFTSHGKKVLFHCEHGHGRTSTFCVLARIAQGWNLIDALKEEEQIFHYNFKHPAQKEFLKKYFSKQKEVI